ncbi:MAG TPA: glycosyl transferase, partial [Reyranella sp.]|nr:glycosyl transferase [Reyranella sp.]
MLLSAIDLVVALCLAVQFALAGYFFYLLYWLAALPAAADVLAPLPPDGELPRVLVQIPVYNEAMVVD